MTFLNYKSIRGKISILALAGVVFLVVFLLINNYYLRYINTLAGQNDAVAELKTEYISFNSYQNEFFNELLNNNDILFLSISNYQSEIEENHNHIKHLLDSVSQFNIVLNDSTNTKHIELLNGYLIENLNEYSRLLLSYRERGTLTHNLIRKLTETGDKLEAILTETEDPGMLEQLMILRKSEKNYLLYTSTNMYNNIEQALETINMLIEFSFPDYKYKTSELIKTYNKTITHVGTLNQRMGIADNQGIRQYLSLLSKDIQTTLNDLISSVNKQIKAEEQRAKTLLNISYLVIILAFIILLLQIGRSIIKPIINIRQFTSRLKKGEIPQPLELPVEGDLQTLIHDINELLGTLNDKKHFAIELGNNNLEVNYNLVSKKDILGKALINLQKNLVNAYQEHQKHVDENKVRQYINEGLAKFGDIMRIYSHDLSALSDEFIKELVKYLNSIQGALFLISEEEKFKNHLELRGAFAYNRKKYIDKKILIGTGLVGACAIEKKAIIPKNVPEDYIQITSGLGDSKPSHLILVPVLYEDKVEGVFEIAGLHPFENHQVNFLNELASSLGAALHSIKINARTTELLKKSQQQAAEMSEQEEEMRQNMEELQATQEEASRREEEMNSMLTSYLDSLLVMEYSLDGTVLEVNRNYLNLLELSENDVIDKTRALLFNYNTEKDEYKLFFEQLANGETKNLIEVFTTRAGNKKYIQQIYSPVRNSDGVVLKIMNLATDITTEKLKESEIDARELEIKGQMQEVSTLNNIISSSMLKAEFNAEGILLDANKNFHQTMGTVADATINKHYNEFLAKAGIEKFDNVWESILQHNRPISTLYRRTRPTGDFVWLSTTFTPVIENKEVSKLILLANDITDNIQRIIR